ncbi:uncharacterized protein LOC101463376 [Ceratitis capitata]|uniref:(Mediterranean fruit fly) hypothetical protein n=1 Tax=Ceratitis capitata TaxID=7213 RepID=A0A811VH72_CERCA|nr:uncharacterized protein LOC101463376 [Ceratitis capitata]CAD7013482.1 unnamed protein product [Ceratitis capitata]
MMAESNTTPNTPAADNSNNTPAAVAPETDNKAPKQLTEKELKEQQIYNNFATPLIGTYLNLPEESVLLKCPACGIVEKTQVENDMKWWATEINRFVGCLWVTFCCCFCMDYFIPCKQTDRNHYCKNCGCYFGRAMKHSAIKPKKLNDKS